jgi:hypothetical protein
VSSIIANLKNGGELKIDFTHYGFNKAETNAFTIYSTVTIQFLSFTYRTKLNNAGDGFFEKLYDENLTNEEIELIAKEMAKIELEEIKRRTK